MRKNDTNVEYSVLVFLICITQYLKKVKLVYTHTAAVDWPVMAINSKQKLHAPRIQILYNYDE